MRILKGDIIAASGEFIRGSGLECGRPLPFRDTTKASGTTAYEYDLLGRVTEAEETRSGPLTFTTAPSAIISPLGIIQACLGAARRR